MSFSRKSLSIVALCLFSISGLSSAHAASLIGDNVDIVLTGGIELMDVGIEVTNDVEIVGGDASTAWGAFLFPTESIDFGESTITMIFDTSLGSDAMLTISDLDFGTGITGVALISDNPVITQANVSFTSDSITIDLAKWFDLGGAARLELTLAAAPVPLPAAFWLFATALGGLGVFKRRKA